MRLPHFKHGVIFREFVLLMCLSEMQIDSITREPGSDDDAEGGQDGTAVNESRDGRPAASRPRAASAAGRRGGYAEYSDDDDDLTDEVRIAVQWPRLS